MGTEQNQGFSEEARQKYEHYQFSQYPDVQRTAPEQERIQKKKRRKKENRRFSAAWLAKAVVSGCFFGLFAALVFLLITRIGTLRQDSVSSAQESGLQATEPVSRGITEEFSSAEISLKEIEELSSLDTEIAETVKKYGIVAGVAQAVMPSIVAITSVSIQEIPSYFGFGFGYGYREYPSTGSGSGIIVGENEEELLIATNNHVVEGASTLSVCFIGNNVQDAEKETANAASGNGDINLENAITAKIKGTDGDNDLAVIAVKKSEIPQETMAQIRIAKLSDSEDVVVGEQVAAIGNALGYGQTLTVGYISALERTITTSDGETASGLIQTDAAINFGNSGGALLNMQGEVIGINSAKSAASSVEGVGYAIPISKARPILEELMSRRTRDLVEDEEKAAFLGVALAEISSEARQMYSVPDGAFIARVYSGSPAYEAGLSEGDVIGRMDGQKISGKDELLERLRYYSAGETVELQIARANHGEYQEMTVSVVLGSKKNFSYTG